MSSYYEKFADGKVVCIDDEIPFEIPNGWEWCRLEELISYQNGYAYTSSELNKEGKGLPVIKSGNLMTYEVVLKPNNDYVENPSTKMLASAIKKGDLLMCLSSQSDNPEPLGKTAIYKANNTALLNQRVLKMRPWLEDMLEYMYYAINSEYFHYTVSHQGGGSAQANLKLGHVLSMLIPLAPLKEEIRIVDKINTIMPLLHQYETTFLKQKKLNSELNDRLKSAILQEAIQGKLVPQDPDEEPASILLQRIRDEKQRLVNEGKLKKKDVVDSIIYKGEDNKYYEQVGKQCKNITEEIPFEIPKNWSWCRLGNIISISSGENLTSKQMQKGNIPVYGGNGITGYHSQANVFEETIVIGRVGYYCGSIHLTHSKAWVTDNAFITRYSKLLNRSFLIKMLTALELGKRHSCTAQPVVSGKNIYPILIPIPPLLEQQRIVAQIERLFEQLK